MLNSGILNLEEGKTVANVNMYYLKFGETLEIFLKNNPPKVIFNEDHKPIHLFDNYILFGKTEMTTAHYLNSISTPSVMKKESL